MEVARWTALGPLLVSPGAILTLLRESVSDSFQCNRLHIQWKLVGLIVNCMLSEYDAPRMLTEHREIGTQAI